MKDLTMEQLKLMEFIYEHFDTRALQTLKITLHTKNSIKLENIKNNKCTILKYEETKIKVM